jgi:lysine 2,3-aminomutase
MTAQVSPIGLGRKSSGKTLTEPRQILDHVPGLSPERVAAAEQVASEFAFRIPQFYAQRVLNGRDDDPLLDLAFPSLEEFSDGPELWDATPSPYSASDSPFWVQKYQYQGLIRLTTVCSGLCRFCYLKKKNVETSTMKTADVDRLFDDLMERGGDLREIILSGGDPLCVSADLIEALADRMDAFRTRWGRRAAHITIHTREPVWDPEKLLRRSSLIDALRKLKPKTYMINVLHPREVTSEFEDVCSALSEEAGVGNRPALLCQHPLFKGVNDSADTLEDLYTRLMACSPPVLPYYLVHPFYNGTLPQHRLSLRRSQEILQELVRRPGCLAPTLVVPTPQGKCQIGPHERLVEEDGSYRIVTKDGVSVLLP